MLYFQMFVATSRGAKLVRSVTVVRDDRGDVPSPIPNTFNRLGKPQRRDVLAPTIPFVKECFINAGNTTQSTAELFEFKNVQLKKRLDVYKWTAVETVESTAWTPGTIAYDVFHLKIVDI